VTVILRIIFLNKIKTHIWKDPTTKLNYSRTILETILELPCLILVRFSHLYIAKARNKETRRTRSSTSGHIRTRSKKETKYMLLYRSCSLYGCIPFTIYYYISKFETRLSQRIRSIVGERKIMGDAIAKVGNKYRRSTNVIAADKSDIPSRWSEKGASITVPGQPVAGMRTDCVTVID